MKQTECCKDAFVRILGVHKPCIRKKGHRGACSPNLIGLEIGSLIVEKLGPTKILKDGRSCITYICYEKEFKKFKRAIPSSRLACGRVLGIRKHGHQFSYNLGKVTPEYITVAGHFYNIFIRKLGNYKNMPFYDGWNPRKNGAYWRGAKWIIENLGKRPKGFGWSLDIIKHRKGFIPGNLRWTKKTAQKENQIHRTLGKFSVQELRVEAKRHGYILIKEKNI